MSNTPVQSIIEIIDDGIGFQPEKLTAATTGIGLKNIQHRCTLIQASHKINSTPGKGTSVQIVINNSNYDKSSIGG